MTKRSAQDILDELKLRLAEAALQCADIPTIRAQSLANLERWKASGAWSLVYDEWRELMECGSDEEILFAMTSPDEDANRLRQSPPYVGIVEKDVKARIVAQYERLLAN